MLENGFPAVILFTLELAGFFSADTVTQINYNHSAKKDTASSLVNFYRSLGFFEDS